MMKQSKKWLLLVMIALICMIGVGETIAYLVDKTDAVTNVFSPTTVGNEVVEEFDDYTKSNVRIKNTGTTSAYIRVAVVGNWCDAEGNVVSAWEDDIDYNVPNWLPSQEDGFWYYKYAVQPEDNNSATDNSPFTDVLFSEYDPDPSADGTHLELQIISQAIQAEPDEAVESVWPVTVNSDDTLQPN